MARVLRVVFVSIQTADAKTFRTPFDEVMEERGLEGDLYCVNAEDVDNEPEVYHELVQRTKQADMVILRVMSDPERMKRFHTYQSVLEECPGYVFLFTGNVDVRLLYRQLFKGSDEDFVLLGRYMTLRGEENDRGIVGWLCHKVTGEGDVPEPIETRSEGIYHPDHPRDVTREDYLKTLNGDRPTVGLMFTANLWIYDNLQHIDMLIHELEALGLDVIPIFFSNSSSTMYGTEPSSEIVKRNFTENGKPIIDVLVVNSPFSQINNSRGDVEGVRTPDELNFFRTLTDVPVIQASAFATHYPDFEESASGHSKENMLIGVFWPEIDGQIITVPLGSNEGGRGGPRKYSPLPDRIRHFASLVRMWAVLSHTPPSERKVAILMYQSRPESGRIGNAAGLDTIESVRDMIDRFSAEGYTVDHVPATGRELIDEILDNITNDLEWSSDQRIREKAADLVTPDEYMRHYSQVPEFDRKMMEGTWGKPPGEVATVGRDIVIPGIVNGNVMIGYQPLRSWADNMEAVYHDPSVPIPHSYLAFYRWLKYDFKANVVFHMGTHGTLEWLPGKSTGLSAKCFPDIVLDGIPHIYPYVIDDPGEGIQAKRRSEAVLIGHMCPTMARAGTYEEISSIEVPLQEFMKARGATGERRTELVRSVMEAVDKADMRGELGIPPTDDPEGFEPYLEKIHDYITEIKDALVRDGLHILGRAPEEERMDETVYSLMRLRNGDVPSLREAFFSSRGYDLGRLLDDPSGETEGRLNGEILDSLDAELSSGLREMRLAGYEPEECKRILHADGGDLGTALNYLCGTLVPNIMRMTDEMDNLMHGCGGGYVPSGPSGAPTRGNAHLLPMGRNYYGIDPDIIPPRSSWEIGKRMADQMIERYVEEKGVYPREVWFIVWATDTMKTNGDDVAYILWLMGVRPVWSPRGGQVVGLEPVPLSELGRPRIDVTVRITGLFRDAFPNLIDLIDDAVRLVADLDEDDEDNYLAANLRKDVLDAIEKGIAVDEARRLGSVRIFGCPPGTYGP
ncbi:MAG: cobaltochelatase subunit CobN, partial [Candidatus Methanomethylophilaceae archaeon]|nr:cobaltochelatase subunit CobN [Candidatus Methanomethylophilaceae archaeon]